VDQALEAAAGVVGDADLELRAAGREGHDGEVEVEGLAELTERAATMTA